MDAAAAGASQQGRRRGLIADGRSGDALRIVALGHRMPAWVTRAVADYTKRLPREFAFELVELKPAPRDRGGRVPQLLADEARAPRRDLRGCAYRCAG